MPASFRRSYVTALVIGVVFFSFSTTRALQSNPIQSKLCCIFSTELQEAVNTVSQSHQFYNPTIGTSLFCLTGLVSARCCMSNVVLNLHNFFPSVNRRFVHLGVFQRLAFKNADTFIFTIIKKFYTHQLRWAKFPNAPYYFSFCCLFTERHAWAHCYLFCALLGAHQKIKTVLGAPYFCAGKLGVAGDLD